MLTNTCFDILNVHSWNNWTKLKSVAMLYSKWLMYILKSPWFPMHFWVLHIKTCSQGKFIQLSLWKWKRVVSKEKPCPQDLIFLLLWSFYYMGTFMFSYPKDDRRIFMIHLLGLYLWLIYFYPLIHQKRSQPSFSSTNSTTVLFSVTLATHA